MKILIFNDEKSIEKTIKTEFYNSDSSNNIIFAYTNEDFCNVLKNNDIDLVVLDVDIAKENVFDTLKSMKLNEKHLKSTIVALCNKKNDAITEQLKIIGFSSIILKPLNAEKLLKIVDLVKINQNTENKVISKLYNLSYLDKFSGGNKEFEAELITYYIENSSKVISDMKKHFSDNELEKVARLAHTFANQSYFFGYLSLYEHIQKLEKDAFANNKESAGELIFIIDTENNNLIKQLKTL